MAIQNSSEIQAIEERLDLADDRVGYQRSQQWTNYLTLDPMQLIQNLLGGGAVQRNEIAIAELEMRAADLIRRRQEVAEGLGRDIIRLVLRWERLERDAELLDSQLLTQRQRVAVLEAGYRTGAGSTPSMLSEWQRTEDLAVRRGEKVIEQSQVQRELAQLVGVGGDAEVLEIEGGDTGVDSGGDRAALEVGNFIINSGVAVCGEGNDTVCADSNETRLIIER